MGVKYLNNIDLNGNQILNAALQNLGTDPGSPVAGQVWMNTGSSLAKYYSGSSTITLYDSDTAATASKLVLRDGSGNIAAAVATFVSITISGTPTNSTDAATKGYVDAQYNQRDWKDPVRVASAGSNINVSFAPSSIDGVSLNSLDRILLKDQTTASENGIYVFNGAASALTRSDDASSSAQVTSGMTVPVTEGTTNDNTIWFLTTNNAITLGTTSLAFVQVNGGSSYTNGTGISISGNVISLASGVATPGTYSSVTVDTYGRVTAGADIVTSNGIVARTGSGTFSNLTITGTSGTISVSNGSGASGNPTLTIDAGYVGQTSITTLGTVTSGTWTGTSIAVANGGTGATTASSARSNLAATGKYSATIGDGSSTSIAITQATHGLASNGQVHAQLFDASTGDLVYPGININNSNGTVTFSFTVAPTSNAYRVVIVG